MNRDLEKARTGRSGTSERSPLPRLGTTILAAAFPIFSLLLYLPCTIYASNLNEFTLRLEDFALIFIPAAAFSVACGAAILLLLPGGLRRTFVSLGLALGLLLWIQGSLLVWRYGTFDGGDIAWESFWRNGAVDTPIWVVVLLISLVKPTAFAKVGRVAAGVIMAVQSIVLLMLSGSISNSTDDASARNYSIDSSLKYSFSEAHNVILVVLDAYQSDVFQEITITEPEYAKSFQGFTYFRDAVAGSNYTELAIPALLTGRMYDNSESREEFLKDAFLESAISTRMKREGYVVDIYPWLGWGNESIYFDEAIASNLTKIDSREVAEPTFTEKKAKETLHLLDLSLFRAAPHFFKPYIFNDHKWVIAYAATYLLPEGVKQVVATDHKYAISTFIAQAPQTLPVNVEKPVFKYLHFAGVHSPLSVDEDLEFTSQIFPFSRENYLRQAKANLLWLGKLFQMLQDASIYDKSLIVVVGDHGSGETAEMYIEPEGAERTPLQLEGSTRNFRRDKARAIPLVLVKPIGASGQLEVSDAPVSLQDVPSTIAAEVDLDTDTERPSMFELEPGTPRVRHHGAFEFSPNKSGFVDAITKYEISGDSWLNESWTVAEILIPPKQPEPE